MDQVSIVHKKFICFSKNWCCEVDLVGDFGLMQRNTFFCMTGSNFKLNRVESRLFLQELVDLGLVVVINQRYIKVFFSESRFVS
jgi:hypothetical protein